MARVCVYTGSRSEYGLLRPVLLALRDVHDTTILVGGSHTREDRGQTAKHIAADGLDALVYGSVWSPSESGQGLRSQAAGVGLQTVGCAEVLHELAPDLLIVYGDRSEALAATVAAHYLGIPIAHIEAGDVTMGGMPDDRTRDAITALSSLALCTSEPAAVRAAMLTPHPPVVVGLPNLDVIRQAKPLLGFEDRPTVLLAINPWPGDHRAQIAEVLQGLASVHGLRVLATRPNGDPGSDVYESALEQAPGVTVLPHMPPADYAALLVTLGRHMDAGTAMVGNSSSALKEAPTAGLPVVDIGPRQAGRLRSPLTLHAPAERRAIAWAVTAALAPGYRQAVRDQGWTGYGSGNAAQAVVGAIGSFLGSPRARVLRHVAM